MHRADSEEEVLELPKSSRVRLTFAEDACARDPPDLTDLEGATAMPLDGARARGSEFERATALPATDAWCPPVSDLWEQLEALEKTKQDWEQEREALEREREALELKREQEREAFESERYQLSQQNVEQHVAVAVDSNWSEEKGVLRDQFSKEIPITSRDARDRPRTLQTSSSSTNATR
uniref:Uncharacterized protein n=1 Tax=Sphaerodactylus townsendi TaxID=933632 RepID=A0ACB8G0Y0_9SAUR